MLRNAAKFVSRVAGRTTRDTFISPPTTKSLATMQLAPMTTLTRATRSTTVVNRILSTPNLQIRAIHDRETKYRPHKSTTTLRNIALTAGMMAAASVVLYKATTEKKSDVKSVPFNQTKQVLPYLYKMTNDESIKGGACQGLVLEWGYYTLLGKDFLNEINALKDNTSLKELPNYLTEIYSKQMLLAKDIKPFQSCKTMRVEPDFSSRFKKSTDEIATKIMNEAVTHPDHLIFIGLVEPFTGWHAIGVTARQTQHGYVVNYFDPNWGEATHSNATSAQEDLAKLLRNYYSRMFKHEFTTIETYVISLKTLQTTLEGRKEANTAAPTLRI